MKKKIKEFAEILFEAIIIYIIIVSIVLSIRFLHMRHEIINDKKYEKINELIKNSNNAFLEINCNNFVIFAILDSKYFFLEFFINI